VFVSYDPSRALELLRIGSGNPHANFREDQEEAIRRVVESGERLLVVQRTGWGKSFVYFIATKLLREAGCGPVLLISPLLSLMRNQVAAAERMGVRAATRNSSNTKDWPDIHARIWSDELDILLISPECLANEKFRGEELAIMGPRLSLLTVDEAHCISDWGHDFRPHYRLIERALRRLPSNVRLLATTATANDRVMADLTTILGPKLGVLRGDLARPSLTLQTIPLSDQAERLAWLAEHLHTIGGSGIIYVLTVSDANRIAGWLGEQGLNVASYSAEEDSERRVELENALLHNEVKALVATVALGMGFDKPDLAFVIHYQMPGSVVAYYQQVGRAGRALDTAYGVLLAGGEDVDINHWFIDSAFPSRGEVSDVLGVLEREPDGLSEQRIQGHVNMKPKRVKTTLSALSLESPSPVVKEGSRWQLTASRLDESFWERTEHVTSVREEELRQMRQYVGLPFGSHMAFLIEALDGDPSTAAAPSSRPLPVTIRQDLVEDAVTFLRRTSLPIEPRKQWPADSVIPGAGTKPIPCDHRAQPGRALSTWGDAGWGTLVYRGKYHDGRFCDDLVAACARMVRQWDPQPSPTWVSCVPSRRRPDLVPNFARRLADALGLPFHEVLLRVADAPEQKTMENSVQQARNVWSTFASDDRAIPPGPILLIDDVVDSRWTLTMCAWLLLRGGSGPVWPVALSRAGGGA